MVHQDRESLPNAKVQKPDGTASSGSFRLPRNPLHTTTPSAEPRISVMVAPTFGCAINLETNVICLFLSKDGELRTEYRRVQFRHFLIEFFRQAPDPDTTKE